MSQKTNFYPNVDEYNADNFHDQPVTIENLDLLIYKIVARSGLTYDQVSIIVKLFFNISRTEVLKGNVVHLGDLGSLFIKYTKNKNSKLKYSMRLKFKATRYLIKKARFNALRK